MAIRQSAQANPSATRQFIIPDPVRPLQTCEVQISAAGVMLRRRIDGINMHIGLNMTNYRGIAAAGDETTGYSLELTCRNAALSLPLGQFATLDLLAMHGRDWARFTGLPLLVQEEAGFVQLNASARPNLRRPGQASALKTRRGGFAKRRKAGDQSRAQTILRGAREIIAREIIAYE